MRKARIVTIVIVMVLLFAVMTPASAQLGDTDVSSFTIQNVDTVQATVTVTFIDGAGVSRTPNPLSGGKANPFTLNPGESFEIYVPGIPSAQLPTGKYSVVIASSARVAAIANLLGQGTRNFNGSYSGLSAGATRVLLPAFVYHYYGWYSLISVQNVGTGPTNITVNITCSNGATGTYTATNVPANASTHFVTKTTPPTGFTTSTVCDGSAEVLSTNGQPLVAVDNQTVPTGGNTQSYSGVATGASKLYGPALYKSYYGWNASLNVRKVGSGNTNVTVTYSDSGTSNCALTDAVPSCLFYMPGVHPGNGYFGATVESSNGMELVGVVNAANGSQAQTYSLISSSTSTSAVGIPSVMKSYYGWNTSFTCQNVGTVASTLHVEYSGYAGNAYNTISLAPGATLEKYTPGETFLPNGYQGGVTITANTGTAKLSCIVNLNNPTQASSTLGDWSMSYNAFSK
jgi:hypothetical protein